jgi:hypothetical protein
MPPALFAFSYFSDSVSLFAWGSLQTTILLPMPPMELGSWCVPPLLAFFVEMGSHFLPRLPLILYPPDLCLLRSWDYRHEPLRLVSLLFLISL